MNAQIEKAKQLIEQAYAILDQFETERETPPQPVSAEIAPTQPAVLKKGEVTYTGKIGRPQFKTTQKGLSLWTAGLGIDQGDGQLQWLNVVAWRDVANHAQQFESGDSVIITGKPGTETYTDRDGVLIERHIIVVSSIDWQQ